MRGRSVGHVGSWVLAALLAGMCGQTQAASAESPPTVGMPRQITGLVLPGSELEVIPLTDRRAPVVVRIVRSAPHGSAWRYDLNWYGLETGEFDLSTWLRRKDGSSTDNLAPIPVKVVSALADKFALPHELAPERLSSFGSYRIWGGVVLALWGLGLFAIMRVGRRRHEALANEQPQEPATIAERLRPLVQRGIDGTITPGECATLERCLLQFWAERLDLQRQTPAECFRRLREHPEASPLLRQLEVWLHEPSTGDGQERRSRIDVEALLRPYGASHKSGQPVGANAT